MILILNFKLENKFMNINEVFKDFSNKDYIKKVSNTIDNYIGL